MFSLRRLIVPVVVVVVLASAPAAGFGQVVKHEEGSIGPGSFYEMDVPVTPVPWNGILVLYAHGIVQADQPVVTPSRLDGYDGLRSGLLASGFAVAASSFSTNGWAVADAVRRTHQLGQLFVSKFGQPTRVLLMGHSLGGLVIVKLAETYPGQYDGALALCAPLGGGIAEIRYAGDARVTLDAFFRDLLPGTPFYVPPGTQFYTGSELYNRALGTLATHPEQLRQWVLTAGIPFNPGSSPLQAFTGMLSSAMYFVGFQLRYTNDFIERVNGKIPYDNVATTYVVPGDEDTSEQLNVEVRRYFADQAALNYYDRNYEPTGDIRFPVVTLHSTWDPGVPLWHEDLYARKVAEAGNSGLLTQLTEDVWGHCTMTPQRTFEAFGILVGQVLQPAGGRK